MDKNKIRGNHINIIFLLPFLFCLSGIVSSTKAQIPDRIISGIMLQTAGDDVEGGFGWQMQLDYSIFSRNDMSFYIRPGIEYGDLFPIEREVYSTEYRRIYGSLSLVGERKINRTISLFLETGGGYMSHKLTKPLTEIGFYSREDLLAAGPAGHIRFGFIGQFSRHVLFQIGAGVLYTNTQHTKKQVRNYGDLLLSEIIDRNWLDLQTGFSIMFRI